MPIALQLHVVVRCKVTEFANCVVWKLECTYSENKLNRAVLQIRRMTLQTEILQRSPWKQAEQLHVCMYVCTDRDKPEARVMYVIKPHRAAHLQLGSICSFGQLAAPSLGLQQLKGVNLQGMAQRAAQAR